MCDAIHGPAKPVINGQRLITGEILHIDGGQIAGH